MKGGMTMAVKTVGAQGYDAVMALNAATAARTANNNSQSFGEVLNKAGDKIADNVQTNTKTAETARESQQQENQMSENKTSQEGIENTDKVQREQGVTEEKPVDSEIKDDLTTDDVQQNAAAEEEPVDKLTTEQIADALLQIIEQLKQLCGVSEEEILTGMQSIDMHPAELFDANRMAQLVTVIAGEGEIMSLVTNEDLYAALQTLTATAETVSSQLLEDMGLTQEEFDAVLAKLNQTGNTLDEILMPEEVPTEEVAESDSNNAVQQEKAPIVLVEENVKPDDVKQLESQVAKKQFDNVAETQQKDVVAETQAKPQSQKSDHEAHEQKNNAGDFNGQQGTQNFDNKLNEAQAAAESTARYTSESTENILRQLADLVKIVKNENLTQMELQLHPASLGTVNVSLVTKGGAVTAEFTTQNEAVKAAIESQVSQLMTNLEEQGVKVEAVEVSVASHQMERNLDENNRDGQNRQEREEEQRVQGTRRNSINLNAYADDGEMLEELQGADDATRIAMEMMAANGNSMDLMA